MWQAPPPPKVAKTLRDDSIQHCVLVFNNIAVISMMEATLNIGQNFKGSQILTPPPQADLRRKEK